MGTCIKSNPKANARVPSLVTPLYNLLSDPFFPINSSAHNTNYNQQKEKRSIHIWQPEMAPTITMSHILVAVFVVLVSMEAALVMGQGKGKGNANGKKADEANYDVLTPLGSGQERGFCKAKGACYYKTLTCPSECPQRKPKKNKKNKGCFINCGSKCEATCKYRKSKCDGYGSLCYDPRFVGGDGVMFYFHGAKGGNFAIVSDTNLQINAHFIGTRPTGRTRDFTWVQAFAVMFDSHTLVVAAKRVSKWDDKVDALMVKWDDKVVTVPTDGDAEWRTNGEDREVVVERTDDTNYVRVTVAGLVEMDIRVRPIGEKENKVHNYQIPADDTFAHLETQFRFTNLSDLVEGVLGKTYRPGYVSPVKVGVPMPMAGGEDKYETSSLFSPLCKVCRFQKQPELAAAGGIAQY